MNSFYNHNLYPITNSPGSSAAMRAELDLIAAGFDKMPTLAGNANKLVIINSNGDGLTAVSTLPNLEVIDSTFFIQDNVDSTKKVQFQASGLSSGVTRVLTVPDANLTLVGLDTTQTLTNKTLTSPVINTPIVSGGTLDNTVIGGTTPAAGTFTSLAASTATVGGAAVVTISATQTLTNKTISGGTVTGAAVTGLSSPSAGSDAANKTYVDTADALKLNLAGGTMSGAIAMGSNKITGLGTPTADADAATKAYVDSTAQGLDIKASVRVATTGNITLSGTQTIDGVSVNVSDRVLVKSQSTASENGIYVVASGGWTRATDMDVWSEFPGAFFFVEEGTVNDNTGWVCTVAAGGTLGSTAVTFEQFSGAGQITAGAGLTKSGNTIDIGTASSSRIVVNTNDIDLATTGVSAGTYRSVTVDAYGRVTAGTAPTTISGYGITDAYTKTEVDNALALKLNLSGGTMSGNLAMGSNKITGLGTPTVSTDAVTLGYVTTLYGSTASAASSAADALTYKNAAESAATTATTQASTATTQAGIATTQAGIATTQAGLATTAANNAEAAWDAFDDRYLGAKSSPPLVDNDGNPLTTGALYFDTTTNLLKIYTSSNTWVTAGYTFNGTSSRATYTATAGQTTFAITYDVNYVDVYLNGLKLQNTVDFTATNGTSVVLTTGATAGDVIDIVAYGTFNLVDAVTRTSITGSAKLPTGTTAERDASPAAGYFRFNTTSVNLEYYSGSSWVTVGGTGTVTSVNVSGGTTGLSFSGGPVTSSGTITLAGTLAAANGGLGLTSVVSGLLKGNGTAYSAAVAGTDYLAPPSGTSLLKANSGGALANAVAGTDYLAPPSGTALLKANSGGALANAVAGTDYVTPSGSETLTNKTLTSPVISGGSIDNAAIGATIPTTAAFTVATVNGVQFPATQVASANANQLDDYEEGTFTPAIAGTTSAGTGTYSSQVGKYTKIGNIVNFYISLTWSAHTGTGNMQVTGLPFASSGLATAFFAWVNGLTLTASNVAQLSMSASTTTIVVQQTPVGGGSFSAVAMDTVASLIISGSYPAAT